MSGMKCLDGRQPSPDLELDKFLQQYIVELQEPKIAASQPLSASCTAPSWLSANNQASINFDTQQGTDPQHTAHESSYQELAQPASLLQPDTHGQEQQDEMQPVSSGSGATMYTGKPAAGAGKRTEAWTAKNRRAQKKFREKAKVGVYAMVLSLQVLSLQGITNTRAARMAFQHFQAHSSAATGQQEQYAAAAC